MNKGMYSSNSYEWETPKHLFDSLDSEFDFNLDPCASHFNAKCSRYFTEEDNGLTQDWKSVVFMNPPYGRRISAWVHKAYNESQKGALVVGLLPARTDTQWFHDWVYHKAEIRFLEDFLWPSMDYGSVP